MSAPMVPPHDLEAERAIVAAALADAGTVDEVADILEPGHFYASRSGIIWGAIRAVHGRGEPVDLVMVRAEIERAGQLAKIGGDEALVEALQPSPAVQAAEVYARRIAALASVRAMAHACREVVAQAYGPIADVDAFLDQAEAKVHAAAQGPRSSDRTRSIRELAADVYEDILRRAESGPVRGIPTGIQALDEMISGLQPQQLVIVAGRPGMGKSALAGAMAMASAATGPVLVWSGEMSREQWAERMIVSESRVHASMVRAGHDEDGRPFSRNVWNALAEATGRVAALPIEVDDTPAISLWQLRSKARRMRARGGLALIIADYLQLMSSGERHNKREEEVAAVSRGLKGLAKELSVPVVALSQLNRGVEDRGDKRPSLRDLRESGQIEQDADVIAFVFRPGYYDREHPQDSAEVIVAKQRSGATGVVPAMFDPTTTRWADAERKAPDYDAPPSDAYDDFSDEDWAR